jgi:uncharacterized coiled-coil protein SlyX
MNSRPNRKAIKPDDVLIVHADELHAHAFQQIAWAGYQRFASAACATKYTLPKATEPDDVRIARADERLSRAYEHIARTDKQLAQAYRQIARSDEQLARLTEQLSNLERRATRDRSAGPVRLPPPDRRALRAFIGFLLAAGIFAAAFVSQSPYGDAVKQIIARWAPPLI